MIGLFNFFHTELLYEMYHCLLEKSVGCFMVFNTTFNNISAISWRSVLLVEETGVLGESHRPAANHFIT